MENIIKSICNNIKIERNRRQIVKKLEGLITWIDKGLESDVECALGAFGYHKGNFRCEIITRGDRVSFLISKSSLKWTEALYFFYDENLEVVGEKIKKYSNKLYDKCCRDFYKELDKLNEKKVENEINENNNTFT